MPEYRCRLATADGEVVSKDFVAADEETLRAELSSQDYLVLKIQRQSAALGALTDLFSRRAKLSMAEFMLFNQEFAALLKAGLPIIEALTLLLERRENPALREALEDVRDRVRTGESLAEAFAAQACIPPLYSSSLASGERSGEIDTVLNRYIQYSQTIANVKSKVVAAVTYPIILVAFSIGLMMLFLLYVLPKFQSFFDQLGSEMPFVTRAVVFVSDFLRGNWLILIVGISLAIFSIKVWQRTPGGKRAIEALIYKIPLVGGIAQRFVMTRFARTLGTLVQGGLPLVVCLEIVARAVETPIYRAGVEQVARKVRDGSPLWSTLDETGLFPGMMIEMVKVGESSGAVAEMLDHVANFTDGEIEHKLQRLIAIIEPLMLVFMAIIVGIMLLAIYYPMLVAYSNSEF